MKRPVRRPPPRDRRPLHIPDDKLAEVAGAGGEDLHGSRDVHN